jgi:DNA invertase Pin-like site-specific DNA recombinase
MIPATRNFLEKDRKVIKNVGAYCRVSTDTEEQQGSYNSQVNYYTEKIKSTPGWRFVKVYGDEGISGTNADDRPGFQEMMQDCENGKLDLIITKSISRFSRNVTVTLEVARKLRDKDIGIFFEKENLNTLHYTSESLLAIFSSLAQAESESMSENIKMGREFKYKNGECCYNMGKVFGFNQDNDGIVTINEEQAVAVRLMYEGYLNVMSVGGIIKDCKKGKSQVLQERKNGVPELLKEFFRVRNTKETSLPERHSQSILYQRRKRKTQVRFHNTLSQIIILQSSSLKCLIWYKAKWLEGVVSKRMIRRNTMENIVVNSHSTT